MIEVTSIIFVFKQHTQHFRTWISNFSFSYQLIGIHTGPLSPCLTRSIFQKTLWSKYFKMASFPQSRASLSSSSTKQRFVCDMYQCLSVCAYGQYQGISSSVSFLFLSGTLLFLSGSPPGIYFIKFWRLCDSAFLSSYKYSLYIVNFLFRKNCDRTHRNEEKICRKGSVVSSGRRWWILSIWRWWKN